MHDDIEGLKVWTYLIKVIANRSRESNSLYHPTFNTSQHYLENYLTEHQNNLSAIDYITKEENLSDVGPLTSHDIIIN